MRRAGQGLGSAAALRQQYIDRTFVAFGATVSAVLDVAIAGQQTVCAIVTGSGGTVVRCFGKTLSGLVCGW